MSVRLISRCFKLRIPTIDKFFLVAMADHAHDDGTHVFPSIKLLADKTSLSDRAVQKALRRLKVNHFIKQAKKESYQHAREYVLTLDKGEPYSPIKGERRSQMGERGGGNRVNVGADKGEPRAPESLRTNRDRGGGESSGSGGSVEGIEVESVKQKQKQGNGKISAATAARIAHAFKAFEQLGVKHPFGPKAFQLKWAEIHARIENWREYVDAMEEVFQYCQENAIPTPGLWGKLKRRVEEMLDRDNESKYG